MSSAKPRLMSRLLPAACVVLAFMVQEARAYDQYTHQLIIDYATGLYNQVRPGREPGAYWAYTRYGAWHEDEVDHVFDHWHPFGFGVTGTHFWDADNGILDPVTLAGLAGTYENAYQKITGIGTSQPYWALWQQATTYYALGDKASAYERLGPSATSSPT